MGKFLYFYILLQFYLKIRGFNKVNLKHIFDKVRSLITKDNQ